MNVEQGLWRGRAEVVGAVDATGSINRRHRLLLIAGGVIAALVLGWWLFLRGGDAPKPAAAALPKVTVIVPGRQPVTATISATGSLAARREMPVGVSGEGGMVSRVLVEPGDWVAAGQTLAILERSVQAQQASSLAASVNVARADAALAKNELERARALVARGFISKADLDRRTAALDTANARVRVAQAQYGEASARIGRLDIRAPAAGLVLTRAVEPGQVVGPANGALFRVAKGGEMELLARVAEQDLARLRVGLPAEVTPVGGTKAYKGEVWQLSPVIDPQTRQGIARVALAYDPALRPGGFAAAQIAGSTTEAPVLPESAVQNDDKGSFVLIVDADGTVVRRDVKVGVITDRGVTILTGLTGTEQVVLSAGAFLNPGEKVAPERAPARRG